MASKRTSELWDRLENETPQAYKAFESYLFSVERTVPAAYRAHVGNPNATSRTIPPYFLDWYKKYAWKDRALAYDHYLADIRRQGQEKAIKKEAERQTQAIEQVRNRMNELLSASYLRAIEWLNDADFNRGDMTARDVIQIVKLHVEATKNDAEMQKNAIGSEDEWTEEDDAEEFTDRVVEHIEAKPEVDPAGLDAFWAEEEGPS